jgi:hypothetical protein
VSRHALIASDSDNQSLHADLYGSVSLLVSQKGV